MTEADLSLFRVEVPEQTRGCWEIKRWKLDHVQLHMGFIVQPGEYTALRRFEDDYAWHTWMSDISSETLCALPFVDRAHGDVLVTGLGLGSVLRPLAAKPEVSSVTVVEIDQALADMVWPTYARDPKLTLVIGDAIRPRRLRLPRRRFTCAWHDIWRDISAKNLPQMEHMLRAWPVDDFSMVWSREQALEQLSAAAALKGQGARFATAIKRLRICCNVDGGA